MAKKTTKDGGKGAGAGKKPAAAAKKPVAATKKAAAATKKPAKKRAAAAKPAVAAPVEVGEAPVADAVVAASDAPEAAETAVAPGALLPGAQRIVVFTMESQRYGLPIDVVQEIQQIVALSELPDASAAVAGVINLRGQVVPAVDLRRLVGVPEKEYDLQTPMIFCRTGQGLVALIVDQVEDVMDVPPGALQAPSSVYALAERLLGVARFDEMLVFVFDIEALVPSDARGGVRS